MTCFFDRLPRSVEIDGRAVKINTDFRVMLKVMRAFKDKRLLYDEKLSVMLRLMYPDIPKNKGEAVRQGLRFLNLGETLDTRQLKKPRVFSFEKDSMFIATAFRATYGIDLSDIGYLHWWAFRAMFSDLRRDCFFNTLVALRRRKYAGKLSDAEKKFVRNNPELFLPDCSETEKRRGAAKEFISMIGRQTKDPPANNGGVYD